MAGISDKNDKVLENDEGSDLEEKSELSRVELKKSVAEKNSPSYLYVLPARGMHLAVPDLKFHNSHFSNSYKSSESALDSSRMLSDDDQKSENCVKLAQQKRDLGEFSKQNYQKESKLPFGLEITAGPGQKKIDREGSLKKAPLPSQTIFASVEYLRSYFIPQDKYSSDKSDATNVNDLSVKNKVLGLWTNMRYGWSGNLKTNFSQDTPIYMLGRIYHKTFKEEQMYYGNSRFLCSNIEGFKKDFTSLAWFTYRCKFPSLPESNLTTDCGWGCMIRSGQMMIHTALSRHFLPYSWRYGSDDTLHASVHKQIMKFFCDVYSPSCPFSLHNLILYGHKMNKRAGNWYGPSCVAHMFKEAVEEGSKHIPELKRIRVYVAQDGAVYVQDILDLCSVDVCICQNAHPTFVTSQNKSETQTESFKCHDKQYISTLAKSEELHINLRDSLDSLIFLDSPMTITPPLNENDTVRLDYFVNLNQGKKENGGITSFEEALAMRVKESLSVERDPTPLKSFCQQCHGWKSCIILIPVRLGGVNVNPIYHSIICSLFVHDLCIGIIGGRPKHSLYFVGVQDNSLIHLDPHLSQEAVPLDSPDFPLETYHCTSPRKLDIAKMDPSATIGFYCHTRSEFYRLLEQVPLISTAKDGSLDSPIFEFVDGRSKDINEWIDQTLGESDLPHQNFTFTPPMCSSAEGARNSSVDGTEEPVCETQETTKLFRDNSF